MTAAALLDSLVRLSARIAITPERTLTLRAPKGGLTPEILATVRAGKDSLITSGETSRLSKLPRSVEDSLTGVLWRDDAQVISLFASNHYQDRAGLTVIVEEMTDVALRPWIRGPVSR